MKATFDTNVLIRLFVADDERHLAIASELLSQVEEIHLTLTALCETVWVMRRGYRIEDSIIADTLEEFLADERIRADWDCCAIGIAMLRAGGDFADGVIAVAGAKGGATTFATFDRDAASLLAAQDIPVTPLG